MYTVRKAYNTINSEKNSHFNIIQKFPEIFLKSPVKFKYKEIPRVMMLKKNILKLIRPSVNFVSHTANGMKLITILRLSFSRYVEM